MSLWDMHAELSPPETAQMPARQPGDPLVPFVVYAPATGRVLRAGSCARSLVGRQARGEAEVAMEGAGGDATHWVTAAGELRERIPLPLSLHVGLTGVTLRADGRDALVITGIPPGATVRCMGPETLEDGVSTEGTFSLVTNLPGDWSIEVDAVPYLPVTVNVRSEA